MLWIAWVSVLLGTEDTGPKLINLERRHSEIAHIAIKEGRELCADRLQYAQDRFNVAIRQTGTSPDAKTFT